MDTFAEGDIVEIANVFDGVYPEGVGGTRG
jgi:hypothetical protein